MDFSEIIDYCIKDSVRSFNEIYDNKDQPLLELVSMGELVDRLSIVNIKLFNLKDKVMNTSDESFRAWASVEDVKLVMERSRLKRAIDQKLIYTINIIKNGDSSGNFVPEVKRYGNENRS